MLNEQIETTVVFLVLFQLVMYENQLENHRKYYTKAHKLRLLWQEEVWLHLAEHQEQASAQARKLQARPGQPPEQALQNRMDVSCLGCCHPTASFLLPSPTSPRQIQAAALRLAMLKSHLPTAVQRHTMLQQYWRMGFFVVQRSQKNVPWIACSYNPWRHHCSQQLPSTPPH